MTDNIRPDHYRTGEIDLYEAFSQIFPHNEYRTGMQMIAMRYMFRDKIDRVEDLGKSIYTLERLKEKEIEHAKKNTKTLEEVLGEITKTSIVGKYFDETYFNREDLLRRLQSDDYDYLTRHENGELWAHSYPPKKQWDKWTSCSYVKKIYNDNFPEVQWSDEEPTKISDLLETYENGGENGKVEQKQLYYAKIKGWDILDGNSNWVYLKNSEELMLGEVTFCGDKIDVMTKEEWNGLGIDDTNADFEEVEVWEADISETYQNGGENGK